MKKSSLIGHIIELLDLIRPLKRPADNIVKEFFRTRHYLGSKDRRVISESLYGILRNYLLSRKYAEMGMAASGIAAPTVPSLAIYAAYALRVSAENAEDVANDMESQWRIAFPRVGFADFVNALKQSDPLSELSGTPARRIALQYSFPEEIVAEWVGRLGSEETELLCASMNVPAPVTIRANTLKTNVIECRKRLKAEGVDAEPTALSPCGLILPKRVNIQSIQSFKEGWFEIQDEGSQLLPLLLEPAPGNSIIDACAGGGGKTLQIGALMKDKGEVLAIDIDEKRLNSIRPRVERAGVTIVRYLLAENGQSAAASPKVDAILIDAPCSGVGTFRRNPAAKLSFTREMAVHLSETQRSLLETYAPLVKPGGRLAYSTCTLLQVENENVIEDFLVSHPEFTLLSAPGILSRQGIRVESSSNYLTLYPHKTGTDGFFAAVLQRQ